MIHVPGRTKPDDVRFHHATQNGEQFKTYELLVFGIFRLIFLDHGWPWVTGTAQSKISNKGEAIVFRNVLRNQLNSSPYPSIFPTQQSHFILLIQIPQLSSIKNETTWEMQYE